MKALGMIEVYGRVGAIEGLDSALKAANVSLVNMIRVGGGLTTFLVEGDVGAVKAAIDAAASAAEKVGKLLSQHVIPRPDESVRAMVDMKEIPPTSTPPKKKMSSEEKTERVTEAPKEAVPAKEAEPVKKEPAPEKPKAVANLQREDEKALAQMTVGELRTLARSKEGMKLSREEIKFAKKSELIDALTKK